MTKQLLRVGLMARRKLLGAVFGLGQSRVYRKKGSSILRHSSNRRVEFDHADRARRKAPLDRLRSGQRVLARIENVRVQRADFLPRIFGSDFENAAAFDFPSSRGKCRLYRAGVIAIGDVEKNLTTC